MDKKKYESSHSWINFNLDARSFAYQLWVLLGAAQSKCRHLRRIAMRPEKQQELLSIYMQKGIRATTAIEGNSLSEEEVGKIIEGNSDIPKSKEYQKMEVENVLKVYNNIVEQIKNPDYLGVSYEQIKDDNKTILFGTPKNIVPGEVRHHSVVVGNYRGAPAEDCEFLLKKLCNWLNDDWSFGVENEIIETVLKAILGHLYIAWIHPFGDGNGRTARALELRLLLNGGVPNIAAHLFSNFYNETRDEYYTHLQESSRGAGTAPFILYAVRGFVDALDKQINIILDEQLRVIWTNFIYNEFSDKSTAVQQRRRDLLLGISDILRHGETMHRDELRLRSSFEVLKKYSAEEKSHKTFNRDIDYLVKNKFVKLANNKISLDMDQIQGFLPISKKS